MVRVESGTFSGASTEQELVPGDGQWILHTPYGSHRPWSLGLWRGLAPWVLLKNYARSDWARHSEKSALLVATSDKDVISSVEKRRQLAQDIYDRGRESVCALPAGFKLELVAAEANTYQLYSHQIAMADTAMAIQIRGGNLTTEVQSGSRAAAEAQERLGDEVKRRFDAQSVSTTIHDQSLVPWAEHNFGSGDLAPWPVYPTGPSRDLKQRAQMLEKVALAGRELVGLGFEIDAQAFIEEFELNSFVKAKPGQTLDFMSLKDRGGGGVAKSDTRTDRERDTEQVQEAAS
jgi:phage gp29-like protein